jgi:hypothetical protein
MPESVNAVDYMMLTNEKRKRDFANNFVPTLHPQFSYADISPGLMAPANRPIGLGWFSENSQPDSA